MRISDEFPKFTGLREAEKVALRWLRQVNGDWDEIEKRGLNGEPDFLIDGEYYEVKRLRDVCFTRYQLEKFPEYNPILLLVDGDKVEKALRFSDLNEGI